MGDKVCQVIRIGDGSLKSFTVLNTGAADRFFQLYDRNTAPVVGATPIFSIPVYKDNGYSEANSRTLGVNGVIFDRGICWAMSTAAATYQPAAITDAVVTIIWE